jgi:hypothetical protein
MNYKSRILAAKLHKMIQNFAVVIVRGSRQVGKSTLLQYELPHWDTVVFDPAMDIGNARRDPDLFLSNHPPPLILDEIQYAPEMLGALKRRVDKAPRYPENHRSHRPPRYWTLCIDWIPAVGCTESRRRIVGGPRGIFGPGRILPRGNCRYRNGGSLAQAISGRPGAIYRVSTHTTGDEPDGHPAALARIFTTGRQP